MYSYSVTVKSTWSIIIYNHNNGCKYRCLRMYTGYKIADNVQFRINEYYYV